MNLQSDLLVSNVVACKRVNLCALQLGLAERLPPLPGAAWPGFTDGGLFGGGGDLDVHGAMPPHEWTVEDALVEHLVGLYKLDPVYP